jgi:ribose-phosphate pyrophosphokinase
VVGIIGEVKGKHALIVDDEIASGGTVVEAARYLQAQGARRVEVAIVHPVLSGNAIDKLVASPIERVVVTNTLPIPPAKQHPMIETVSVGRLLADAIAAIHGGASISSLFT